MAIHIGLYSLREDVLQEQEKIVTAFEQDACLGLELRCCRSYRELTQQVGAFPMDILVFDMEHSRDAENQLLRIAQTMPNCSLVLLSDSERHAVFGYAVHAAGYLETPIDPEEFLSNLVYLIRMRVQKKEQFLPLKVNGVWSQVNMKHIAYLESAGHSLIFHMEDGRNFKTSANFRQYQNMLDINSDFVRCHKSYVVNLSHVKSWEMESFTLYSGTKVNISRPYWQTARSLYACHVTQLQPEKQKAPQKEKPAPVRKR